MKGVIVMKEVITERICNLSEIEGYISKAHTMVAQIRAQMKSEKPSIETIDWLSKEAMVALTQALYILEQRKVIMSY